MSQAQKLSSKQSTTLNALPSKSAKIRYLTTMKWSRREIADKLHIIYQFVYNVQNQKTKSDK